MSELTAIQTIRQEAESETENSEVSQPWAFLDSFRAYLQELIDGFLAEDWKSDPELARRARLIVRFGFLGFGFGALYATFYQAIGHHWGAGIVVLCSIGFGVTPFLLRATQHLKFAGNLLAAIMTVGFAALCCVEGGIRGHAVAWLASVPLCALLLVGKNSGRFWAIVCFAVVAAVVVAEIEEVVLPTTYDSAWHPLVNSAGYIGLVVFMFTLGVIFEAGRERAFNNMQEALQKLATSNDQLVLLNRDKTEFLGIASHDLKNPLSTIITYAEVLASEHDPADIPIVSQAISKAGTQMRDLIVNLLDANAIEEGRVTYNIQRCNVRALIDQSVSNNQLAASRKQIAVSVIDPDGNEPWAEADPATTVQILDNLVSNSLKYSAPGTTVRVQSSVAPEEILISVQDEGPGISQEDQKKLFGKFTRLTARPTAGESSNGLGLSIVKRLAEALSGSVECQSVLGQGATFTLRLPRSI